MDSLPKPVGYTSEMSLDRGEGIFVADAADQYFKTPLFTAEQVVDLVHNFDEERFAAFRAAYCKAKP